MGSFQRQIRSGIGITARHPGLALASAVALTLGVAANSAIFAIVNNGLITHDSGALAVLAERPPGDEAAAQPVDAPSGSASGPASRTGDGIPCSTSVLNHQSRPARAAASVSARKKSHPVQKLILDLSQAPAGLRAALGLISGVSRGRTEVNSSEQGVTRHREFRILPVLETEKRCFQRALSKTISVSHARERSQDPDLSVAHGGAYLN